MKNNTLKMIGLILSVLVLSASVTAVANTNGNSPVETVDEGHTVLQNLHLDAANSRHRRNVKLALANRDRRVSRFYSPRAMLRRFTNYWNSLGISEQFDLMENHRKSMMMKRLGIAALFIPVLAVLPTQLQILGVIGSMRPIPISAENFRKFARQNIDSVLEETDDDFAAIKGMQPDDLQDSWKLVNMRNVANMLLMSGEEFALHTDMEDTTAEQHYFPSNNSNEEGRFQRIVRIHAMQPVTPPQGLVDACNDRDYSYTHVDRALSKTQDISMVDATKITHDYLANWYGFSQFSPSEELEMTVDELSMASHMDRYLCAGSMTQDSYRITLRLVSLDTKLDLFQQTRIHISENGRMDIEVSSGEGPRPLKYNSLAMYESYPHSAGTFIKKVMAENRTDKFRDKILTTANIADYYLSLIINAEIDSCRDLDNSGNPLSIESSWTGENYAGDLVTLSQTLEYKHNSLNKMRISHRLPTDLSFDSEGNRRTGKETFEFLNSLMVPNADDNLLQVQRESAIAISRLQRIGRMDGFQAKVENTHEIVMKAIEESLGAGQDEWNAKQYKQAKSAYIQAMNKSKIVPLVANPSEGITLEDQQMDGHIFRHPVTEELYWDKRTCLRTDEGGWIADPLDSMTILCDFETAITIKQLVPLGAQFSVDGVVEGSKERQVTQYIKRHGLKTDDGLVLNLRRPRTDMVYQRGTEDRRWSEDPDHLMLAEDHIVNSSLARHNGGFNRMVDCGQFHLIVTGDNGQPAQIAMTGLNTNRGASKTDNIYFFDRMAMIATGNYGAAYDRTIDYHVKTVVKQMMSVDPSSRGRGFDACLGLLRSNGQEKLADIFESDIGNDLHFANSHSMFGIGLGLLFAPSPLVAVVAVGVLLIVNLSKRITLNHADLYEVYIGLRMKGSDDFKKNGFQPEQWSAHYKLESRILDALKATSTVDTLTDGCRCNGCMSLHFQLGDESPLTDEQMGLKLVGKYEVIDHVKIRQVPIDEAAAVDLISVLSLMLFPLALVFAAVRHALSAIESMPTARDEADESFETTGGSTTQNDAGQRIQLHYAVPSRNPAGFQWSYEQGEILNVWATGLILWANGGQPVRLMVESVAGSGKSTVEDACKQIQINLGLGHIKTIDTALNVHIAEENRDKNKSMKGFTGFTALGKSNTVQAGGRTEILAGEAMKRGLAMGVDGRKYTVLSRIVISNRCKATKDGIDPMMLNMLRSGTDDSPDDFTSGWYAMSNALTAFVKTAMEEGLAPQQLMKASRLLDTPAGYYPDDAENWVSQIRSMIESKASILGWEENPLSRLPVPFVAEMAYDVIKTGQQLVFSSATVRPAEGAITPNGQWGYRKGEFVHSYPTSSSSKQVQQTIKCLWPIPDTKNNKVTGATTAKRSGVKGQYKCMIEGGIVGGLDAMNLEHLQQFGQQDSDIPMYVRFSSYDAGDVSVNSDVLRTLGITVDSKYQKGGRVTARALVGQLSKDSNAGNMVKANVGSIHRWKISQPKQAMQAMLALKSTFGTKSKGVYQSQADADEAEEAAGVAVIDFADMTYSPFFYDLKPKSPAGTLIVDEVQDLSVLKGDMVARFTDEESNVILVGDRRQSLYLFANADGAAVTANAENFGCQSLPMTICWRNSHNVVKTNKMLMSWAGKIASSEFDMSAFNKFDVEIPNYSAHKAPSIEGWNNGYTTVRMPAHLAPHFVDAGDMVTCRVVAPLAKIAINALKLGKKVILPKGGTDGVDVVVKRVWTGKVPKGRGTIVRGLGFDENTTVSLSTIKERAERYLGYVSDKIKADAGNDPKALSLDPNWQKVQDEVECTVALAEGWFSQPCVIAGDSNLRDSNQFLKWVASFVGKTDGKTGADAIKFASVHRVKGAEGKRAFVVMDRLLENKQEGTMELHRAFMLNHCMTTAEEVVQEMNAVYVASTRAIDQTVLISHSPELAEKFPTKESFMPIWNASMTGDSNAVVEAYSNAENSTDDQAPVEIIERTNCVDCNLSHIKDGDSYVECAQCDGALCKQYSGRKESGPSGCGTPESLDEMFSGKSDEDMNRVCSGCADAKRKPTRALEYGEIVTDEHGTFKIMEYDLANLSMKESGPTWVQRPFYGLDFSTPQERVHTIQCSYDGRFNEVIFTIIRNDEMVFGGNWEEVLEFRHDIKEEYDFAPLKYFSADDIETKVTVNHDVVANDVDAAIDTLQELGLIEEEFEEDIHDMIMSDIDGDITYADENLDELMAVIATVEASEGTGPVVPIITLADDEEAAVDLYSVIMLFAMPLVFLFNMAKTAYTKVIPNYTLTQRDSLDQEDQYALAGKRGHFMFCTKCEKSVGFKRIDDRQKRDRNFYYTCICSSKRVLHKKQPAPPEWSPKALKTVEIMKAPPAQWGFTPVKFSRRRLEKFEVCKNTTFRFADEEVKKNARYYDDNPITGKMGYGDINNYRSGSIVKEIMLREREQEIPMKIHYNRKGDPISPYLSDLGACNGSGYIRMWVKQGDNGAGNVKEMWNKFIHGSKFAEDYVDINVKIDDAPEKYFAKRLWANGESHTNRGTLSKMGMALMAKALSAHPDVADVQIRKISRKGEATSIWFLAKCHTCTEGNSAEHKHPCGTDQGVTYTVLDDDMKMNRRGIGVNIDAGATGKWVDFDIRTGYAMWPEGTRFDSRFAHHDCMVCGKPHIKSGLVPVMGKDITDEEHWHGMWVGQDCAKKFMGFMQFTIAPDSCKKCDASNCLVLLKDGVTYSCYTCKETGTKEEMVLEHDMKTAIGKGIKTYEVKSAEIGEQIRWYKEDGTLDLGPNERMGGQE